MKRLMLVGLRGDNRGSCGLTRKLLEAIDPAGGTVEEASVAGGPAALVVRASGRIIRKMERGSIKGF